MSVRMEANQKRDIVIIGGGVIGATTAYFLTRHSKYNPSLHTITLLEATDGIAPGASGKAGGLLALWAYPACLVSLSYRLHRELAAEHDGANRWGYRKLGCGSVSVTATKTRTVNHLPQVQPKQGGEQQKEGVHSDEKGGKEWEKLHKQDDKAASLLHDSPLPRDLDWIDAAAVEHYEAMGAPSKAETAQVHPYHFTTSMADLAQQAGVKIQLNAKVTAINRTSGKSGQVTSVEYLDRTTGGTVTIPSHAADNQNDDNGSATSAARVDVIVTAGPWTGTLLPESNVSGLRAHSVVYEADVSPYALFTDIQLPSGFAPAHRAKVGQKKRHKGRVDPEIYARPFGEVYACGEPDRNVPLPETADKVVYDEAQCDDIIAYLGTISAQLAAAPIKTKQACYLPRHMRAGQEGNPLIGKTSTQGLWVAAGHTCWGIQNSPATGCLMAEMLMDGKTSSGDVRELDPRRFL